MSALGHHLNRSLRLRSADFCTTKPALVLAVVRCVSPVSLIRYAPGSLGAVICALISLICGPRYRRGGLLYLRNCFSFSSRRAISRLTSDILPVAKSGMIKSWIVSPGENTTSFRDKLAPFLSARESFALNCPSVRISYNLLRNRYDLKIPM